MLNLCHIQQDDLMEAQVSDDEADSTDEESSEYSGLEEEEEDSDELEDFDEEEDDGDEEDSDMSTDEDSDGDDEETAEAGPSTDGTEQPSSSSAGPAKPVEDEYAYDSSDEEVNIVFLHQIFITNVAVPCLGYSQHCGEYSHELVQRIPSYWL